MCTKARGWSTALERRLCGKGSSTDRGGPGRDRFACFLETSLDRTGHSERPHPPSPHPARQRHLRRRLQRLHARPSSTAGVCRGSRSFGGGSRSQTSRRFLGLRLDASRALSGLVDSRLFVRSRGLSGCSLPPAPSAARAALISAFVPPRALLRSAFVPPGPLAFPLWCRPSARSCAPRSRRRARPSRPASGPCSPPSSPLSPSRPLR